MDRTQVNLPVVLGGDPVGTFRQQPWPRAAGREQDYLAQVIATDHWGGAGPWETVFENRFSEYHGADFGLCVANGTVALQLALEALDIGAGDEVIVPAYTWQATAGAVLDVNSVPVLVDVTEDTCCLDPAAVEAAVTGRTRAVIAVHLYAAMADMRALRELTNRHGLALIEDCAHAHGSAWEGSGAGTLGDIGTFSFQSSKSLTCGEGGFVMTGDPVLHERMASLRNCGRRGEESTIAPIQSGNYRMSEWQAAVLTAQLEKFPSEHERRVTNRHWLDKTLVEIPGVRPVRLHDEVTSGGVYAYGFHYDASEFSGVPVPVFRAALAREVGLPLRAPYRPLNVSALYQPLTKRRYDLGAEHRSRIDPHRERFEVAERLHTTQLVTIPHQYLLGTPEEIALIPEAISKLHHHSDQLARHHAEQPEALQPAPTPE